MEIENIVSPLVITQFFLLFLMFINVFVPKQHYSNSLIIHHLSSI